MGQQQRVALASLLAIRPSLLLLDEPFSCLDGQTARKLLEILLQLRQKGCSIMVSTHDVEWLSRIADRVVLLAAGAVAMEGCPEKVIFSPEFAESIGRPLSLIVSELACSSNSCERPIGWTELSDKVAPSPEMIQTKSLAPSTDVVLQLVQFSGAWRQEEPVFSNVNITLRAGEAVAILGPNGTGKSTFARALMGQLPLVSGTVIINQRTFDFKTETIPPGTFAYASQNPSDMIFETSCLREVSFGPTSLCMPNAVDRALNTLRRVGLAEFANAHPRSLSAGQQRLLTIASVLALEADVLILDEPEYGLDRHSWETLRSLLHDETTRGASLILVTHNIEFAFSLCSQFLFFDENSSVKAWSPEKESLEEFPVQSFAPLLHEPDGLMPLFWSSALWARTGSEEKFREKAASLLCLNS